MIDDELELMGRVLRAQAPVVLASDWVVVDDDSCLAWVEVRLHHPGALVVLHLAHQRGRSPDPRSLMVVSRWHEDDEVDVEVEFAVDGEPVGHGAATRPDVDQRRAELRIGLLKAGGRSSGGKTEEEWWLPRHPERTLEVRLRWVDGTREAAVTLDTTAWSAQAALVRELGGPEH